MRINSYAENEGGRVEGGKVSKDENKRVNEPMGYNHWRGNTVGYIPSMATGFLVTVFSFASGPSIVFC